MPTLMPSAPARANSQAPSKVATFPASNSTPRQFRFHQLHCLQNFGVMPVRAIDGEHVDLGLGQFLRALQEISGGSDGSTHAQTALRIFRRVGIFQLLLNVFDRDQALQVVFVVDDEKFLDAMLVKNFFRFFERGSHGHGDEVFLGHHFIDGNVEAGFKAQVAVGKNADELAVLGDGHAGNLVLAHDLERIADSVRGRHGDRIDDHATFRTLHLVDFVGLLLDGQVAVNNPEAALLGKRDRHVRFSHGVHGGAHDGDVQTDIARELRLRDGLRGHNFGASGQQKDVIESKSLRNGKMNHKLSRELSQPYGVILHSREGGGLRQMEWEDILPIRRRSIRKAADNGCLYIALGQFTVSGAVRLPTLPVTLSRTTKRTV